MTRKLPGLQCCYPPGFGLDETVFGAAVSAFAVDHHAAGEHDPPAELCSMQGSEQHGGAEVVVVHVVDDVVEIDARGGETFHDAPSVVDALGDGAGALMTVTAFERFDGRRRERVDGVGPDELVDVQR